VGVVADPGEALLDAGDFETDQAFEDSGDGFVEDCSAKGLVERTDGFVDEDVEGVVDGTSGDVDPAEDVVVDFVVDAHDGGVGAVGPGLGGVVELVDHHVGELSDLVGQRGNLVNDCFQEEVLAKAGEEAGDAKREDDERWRRCGVGDHPSR